MDETKSPAGLRHQGEIARRFAQTQGVNWPAYGKFIEVAEEFECEADRLEAVSDPPPGVIHLA